MTRHEIHVELVRIAALKGRGPRCAPSQSEYRDFKGDKAPHPQTVRATVGGYDTNHRAAITWDEAMRAFGLTPASEQTEIPRPPKAQAPESMSQVTYWRTRAQRLVNEVKVLQRELRAVERDDVELEANGQLALEVL